ncbi:lipoprotein [Tepiditoga spiralis]|uniref:Lipoprotein n=1 Tax=Tepiditoga spiralis TaxID=2108365 RepID=A0A7G1G9A1_9BACT|nr:ABC transporter substrate-binding protein [Tepiditoga spiralis]BBE31533.1 lipoprotein [Tepiditoga spiralis]
MKKLLFIFIIFTLNLNIFGTITDNEIKVGSFQALSGPVAFIGQPMTNGMKAYFNYINDNGGIYGRKINFIVADDQFNPAKTTVEVKRLVENDKVFAIVGGLGTPGCLAVMKYLNDSKIPFVYQGSGSSLLAIPPKKYIFPVQPNYTLEGNIVINHLIKDKHAKKIAIVYRNADDGKEFLNSAKKALEKNGMEPVVNIAINPTANDFSTEMTKLIAARPDSIAVMLFNPQTINFVKQAKQYGLKNQNYILTYANADITFIKYAGSAAENVEAMAWVDVDFSNTDLQVFKIYQKYYKELPNAYAIAGMIAAETFVEGLKRAGINLTTENFIMGMESIHKWNGVAAHEITYDKLNNENSRMGKESMYVLKVKNGIWVKASDWINYSK